MKTNFTKLMAMFVIMGIFCLMAVVLCGNHQLKACCLDTGNEVVKVITCNVCSGSGDCKTCGGDGNLDDESKCGVCNGTGDCWFCNGKGSY